MQPSNIEALDTILLTQLAALVHLQEYTHARNLWRRYSSLSSTCTGTQSNPATLPQFTRLWIALEPLLRAHAQDTTTSSKEKYQNSKDHYIEVEQPSKIDIDVGDIPMVNIHKSLQMCLEEVGNDAAFQLLASFVEELQVSIRDMIAIAVEHVYESIREERCRPLLGFYVGDGSTGSNSVDAYLKGRNWTREETGLWIPYFDPTSACHGGKENKGAGDRIEYLTRVVGFMETQRFNA